MKEFSLPISSEGRDLVSENGSVILLEKSSSLFQLSIVANDVELISKHSNNKCFIEFFELSGCYLCQNGATLKLKVKTDFGSTSAVVRCPVSDLRFPLRVDSEEKILSKVLLFKHPDISEECTVTCPANEVKFEMVGRLIYVENSILVEKDKDSRTLFIPTTSLFSFKLMSPFLISICLVILASIITIFILLKFYYKRASHLKLI